MKKLACIIVLLALSAAGHADYSHEYLGSVSAESTDSQGTSISYRVFNRGEAPPKL